MKTVSSALDPTTRRARGIGIRAVASLVDKDGPHPTLASALEYVKDAETRFKDLEIPEGLPAYAYDSLFIALEATLCQLSESEQRCCEMLGIFREDEDIPYDALKSLWGKKPDKLLLTLRKWRLVEIIRDQWTPNRVIEAISGHSSYRLLDLHRDYLRW